MKHLLTRGVMVAIVAIVLCTGSAQAVEITWPEPNWPGIFEPNQLLTLHLEMDPCDWNAISKDGLIWNDGTQTYEPNASNPDPYGLEVPAWFWMDGEEANKIVVAVRQKSCDPLGDASDRYFKISLKIDINQYYGVDPNAATIWHGLKKLSLETGDDVDVVAEGLACNLHKIASGPGGYGYDNWHANWVKLWVKLDVNDVYRGVYINVEQRDKQFLRNRGIYVSHDSWLYKYWGEGDFELKVGDDTYPVSPAVAALCYDPFVNTKPGSPLYPPGGPCSEPDDANLVADMNEWVNMQGLLAMAATNAFVANPDALFSHYNNAYFFDFNLADIGETRKRMYFPWDQDSIMNSVDWDIHKRDDGETKWQRVILGSLTLRSQYNQIMRDLLYGSLSRADIHAFLDTIKTSVLVNALAADPFNNIGMPGVAGVTGRFDQIKAWYSDRIFNVLPQVWWDEPAGITLLRDGFEETVWNANWTHGASWLEDTSVYAHGLAAAKGNTSGTFTCVDLDASDATAIHIGFWFNKKGTESTDFTLYYYGTSGYVNVAELDGLGDDNEWLHYTDTITDSQYFVSDFKIQFDATLGGGEDVWVDDVVVTKLTTALVQPVISGYILDPKDAGIEGVLVSANNGGGSDLTDPNGYYEVSVPYGWSNSGVLWNSTLTPTKEDYIFDPPERTYSNVVVDQVEQWNPDYKGTSIYDLIVDGYIDFYDYTVFASAWMSEEDGPNWNLACDFDGDNDVDWNDLAKFVLAWVAL